MGLSRTNGDMVHPDPPTASTSDIQQQQDEKKTIDIKIYKNYKISIYKPLIPLKLALFCWFGAGAVISPFLTVFYQQRGLQLSELTLIYIVTPAVQAVGPTLSGIVADKIGRSKPVLFANLVITMLLVGGMLLVPSMQLQECEPQARELKCHHEQYGHLVMRTPCSSTDKEYQDFNLQDCQVHCPDNVTQYCVGHGQNLICEVLKDNAGFSNFTLRVRVNDTFERKKSCYYNVDAMSHKNVTYSWCDVPHKLYCTIACSQQPSREDCDRKTRERVPLFVINFVLLLLFFTFFSNCYRFFDVTSMSLVKEHNSDFGRERFWSILGILVFSPLAGYVVQATTREGEPENYNAAFYMFEAIVLLTMLVVWKLQVQINPPGKKMWKKAATILKSAEALSFLFVLFVLGTTWGFTKLFMFWYLKELDAPSFLLGFVPAASSLYGLPFLLTANWWVTKIGSKNIFLLGLLGYVISCVGYSFLVNPWLCLVLELTSVFTYHLLWVAVILYSHDLAPEGLTATVIATAGGLHYGIGKGSGGLVGGMIMTKFGGGVAYRTMAAICVTAATLYFLFNCVRRSLKEKKTINETSEIKSDCEIGKDIFALQERSI